MRPHKRDTVLPWRTPRSATGRAMATYALMAAVSCGGDTAPQATNPTAVIGHVSSVTVSPTNVTLNIGDRVNLVANTVADQGIDRTVTWTSNDVTKASVSPTGEVTALGPGVVVINATSNADKTKFGTA